jgi:hypothetical protein
MNTREPYDIDTFNHRLLNRAMRKERKATHHENAYAVLVAGPQSVSTAQSCRGTADEVADR